MRSFFSMCSVAGREEDVDARRLAALERLGGARDVAVVGARERADGRALDRLRRSPCTASKSPFDDAAKPASITSTFRRSSWRAMRSFSSFVIEAPGDCSPSRKVVSKMIRLSVMANLPVRQKTKRPAAFASGPVDETLGRGRSASPGRSKKKQEARKRIRNVTRINIAQAGSAVQALVRRVRRSMLQSRSPACPSCFFQTYTRSPRRRRP